MDILFLQAHPKAAHIRVRAAHSYAMFCLLVSENPHRKLLSLVETKGNLKGVMNPVNYILVQRKVPDRKDLMADPDQ